MVKPVKIAVLGCLVAQSLVNFAFAESFKSTPLAVLFQKSHSPALSDLRLGEKWTCESDNIQFVFDVNSQEKLFNKANSNPLVEYQLGPHALKIVEKKPSKEWTRAHIRVLKDKGEERGSLIVEQVVNKDSEDTLPFSFLDSEYRVLQYYVCLRSKVSPLSSLAKQMDLNLAFLSNLPFVDLSLPKMTLNISEAEIREQEELYAAMVSFEAALSSAFQNLYEDNGKRTLLYRMGSSVKKLRQTLNQPSTILELLTPAQATDSPFGEELLKKYWIFQLKIGALETDETFWVFVSRTGERASYNRSFN